MTVGPGTPAHLVEAVSTPFCGRDLGHDLLSQHVPGRTHQLDRIELLTLHGIQQCGALQQLISRQWEESAFGQGVDAMAGASHPL